MHGRDVSTSVFMVGMHQLSPSCAPAPCSLPTDPDTRHTPAMPIDCLKSRNYGESYRNTIRSYFHNRIQAGNITIFDREVAIPFRG
jgi:hypothetical protein